MSECFYFYKNDDLENYNINHDKKKRRNLPLFV